MPPLNPYIAGNPIAGEQGFFGREDVLRQVERAIVAPGQNAVVIFGQRRIGKTSVLLQLQRRLDLKQFVVVYQDLMDKATKPLGEVMRELARSIALELGLDEPDIDFDDAGTNFQRQFLPQVYAALPSTDHHLVLLFDEFDVLDVIQRERLEPSAAANRLFETLRRWIREETRLEFAFALGRDPKDLDNTDFLATFKGARTIRISVLDRDSTTQLITAPSNRIHYTAAAVEHIYNLTNGHPYFTQLLCQLLFDHAYASPDSEIPLINEKDVEGIVPQVFQVGDNVFAWIWDGLSPADRIITSAMAELLPDEIAAASREAILDTLQTRRIRIVTRELEASPEKLVEWQLLQPASGKGYRFLVPLLYRWIRERKPLSQVQDELDRVNPRAQRYYEVGKLELDENNLQVAVDNFERALRANPEHLQARLSVAEAYLELNQLDAAVSSYEEAYKRDDIQSRASLVKALLARAERAEDEDKALRDYERAIVVMPGNEAAKEKRLFIWKARAERAFAAKQYEEALDAFDKVGDAEGRSKVEAAFKSDWKARAERAFAARQYAEALDAFDRAGDADGRSKVEAAIKLAVTYAEGMGALKQGRTAEAVEYFRQIVSIDPDYENAAEELAAAVRLSKLPPKPFEPTLLPRAEPKLPTASRTKTAIIIGGIVLLIAFIGVLAVFGARGIPATLTATETVAFTSPPPTNTVPPPSDTPSLTETPTPPTPTQTSVTQLDGWYVITANITPTPPTPTSLTPTLTDTSKPSPTRTPAYTSPPISVTLTYTTVEVYADRDWQDTGVFVNAGQTVTIQYISSKWSPLNGFVLIDGRGCTDERICTQDLNYPDNIFPALHGSLIGMIGEHMFAVGNSTTLQAPTSGNIYLRINDRQINDNSGSLIIRLIVQS